MSLIDMCMHRVWAMHRPVLDAFLDVVQRHDRGERVDAAAIAAIVMAGREAREARDEGAPAAARPYAVEGRVAVIPIEGIIAPHASMVNGQSQPRGMSVGQIAGAITAAAADSRVAVIGLDFDSPGGIAHGLDQVADAVHQAAAVKPVHAYARRMDSAAYLIGSQASTITVGRMGEVGSIGTYQIVDDTTEQFRMEGVKRYVVKSTEMKAEGLSGMPVTEQTLRVIKDEVTAWNAGFLEAVRSGRKIDMARVLELADGRVHLGEAAVKAGLADRVATYGKWIEQLNALPASSGASPSGGGGGARVSAAAHTQQEIRTMADENKNETATPARVAATAAELRTAFPDDAEFRFGCLEKGLTLLEAKADYSGVLAAKLAESNKRATELQGQLAEAKTAAQPRTDAETKEAARLAFEKAHATGGGAAQAAPGATLEAGAQTVLREAMARGERITLATATWRAAKDPRFAHLHEDWLKRQGKVQLGATG